MTCKVDVPENTYYMILDEWLASNTEGTYFHSVFFIEFELESDAILFKLRFPE